MTQLGNIKGWDFKPEIKIGMDGSTTRESLAKDLSTLEARLKQIPVLIAQTQRSITVSAGDAQWLRDIGWLKRRKWEKEHGKTVEEEAHRLDGYVVSQKAKLASLKAEQGRIPKQIEEINKQINALVKGESVGLEKGLDPSTAKELGQLELQKEREKMAHDKQLREQELEAQKRQAEEAQQQKAGTQQRNWLIGLGVVAVLAIGGYVLYKRKQSAKAATALGNQLPNPLPK